MAERASVLVLGLGNVLCGDDGLGVAAVHEIQARYEIPEGVRILDGGTLGLSLLSYFEPDLDVILVDAVTTDQKVGTLVRLDGEDVAPAVRNSLSVHQVGVADLVTALRLTGAYPRRLILLGLVPATLDLEIRLSPAVQAGMPLLLERIVEVVRELGYELELKSEVDLAPASADGAAAVSLGLP